MTLEVISSSLKPIFIQKYSPPAKFKVERDFYVDVQSEEEMVIYQLKQIDKDRKGGNIANQNQFSGSGLEIDLKNYSNKNKIRMLKWKIKRACLNSTTLGGVAGEEQGVSERYLGSLKSRESIRSQKRTLKRSRAVQGPPTNLEDSLEIFDLEFKSTDPRSLYISNFTRKGFICLSFSNTTGKYSDEKYQIYIFELTLDLQIKNKRLLRGDERQETLDKLIYFGDGKLSICRRDEKIQKNYATFVELDLASWEAKRLFDVDLDAKFPSVCCGDFKSGYAVAFSAKGIWRFEPSAATLDLAESTVG